MHTITPQVLGEESPKTLASMSNLAKCLEDSAMTGESLPLMRRVLELRIKVRRGGGGVGVGVVVEGVGG